MAYTAQPGAAFNVEGSFNNFFQTQLTAKGTPDFMTASQAAPFPTALVNFEYPQQPLTYPTFSVTHLGNEPLQEVQGRNLDNGFRGAQRIGLAQIDCWESYSRASGNHMMNLQQMRDMAARVFATGAAIPVLDIYGTTASPTANGQIIRALPVREMSVGQDPNPDVLRKRLLVSFTWWERVTAG